MMQEAAEYINKYNVLMASLKTFFTSPTGDGTTEIAPYASYLDHSVLLLIPGTGNTTLNCQGCSRVFLLCYCSCGWYESLEV